MKFKKFKKNIGNSINAFILDDVRNKKRVAIKDGFLYERIKKGDIILLERNIEFDEKRVNKYKKTFKKASIHKQKKVGKEKLKFYLLHGFQRLRY